MVKSISFVSLKQLCAWVEVVEYSDKNACGMLAEDGGSFAALQNLCVLGTVLTKSIILQESYLIADSSPEAGSSDKLDCITRAGVE